MKYNKKKKKFKKGGGVVMLLRPYVVCTSFSQHSKTHDTSLPLIGVFTGKAGMNEGHLKHKT